MIQIPSGSYKRHDGVRIIVSSFSLSPYELTKQQWDSVRVFSQTRGYDLSEGSGSGNKPVGNVTWYDAVKFCNAISEMAGLTPVYYEDQEHINIYRFGRHDLDIACVKWDADGYRLPTEAEWEYACKAGTDTKFYWGNESIPGPQNEFAWHFNYMTISLHTREIGLKKPNAFGLYDMSGNVGEWCWDWYSKDYRQDDTANPKGADQGIWRVLRGGSVSLDSVVESDFRSFTYPSYNLYETGMRLSSSNVDVPPISQIVNNYMNDNNERTKIAGIDYITDELSDIATRMIAQLDPECEIYATMKAFTSKQDYMGALKAYRNYFIQQYKINLKEDFKGFLTHDLREQVLALGSGICWFGAEGKRDCIDNLEETKTLVFEWLENRNSAYLEKWFSIMKDFSLNYKKQYDLMSDEELGLRPTVPISWRWNNGYEVPRRMRCIFSCLTEIVGSLQEDEQEFIPADILCMIMLSLVDEHMAATIKDARYMVPNQLSSNGQLLITAGHFMKEFKDAKEWLKLGIMRFTASATEKAMLHDGGDLEQSFIYNGVFLHEAFKLFQLFSDIAPPWFEDIQALMLKRARMLRSLIQPFGGLPAIGTHSTDYPPDLTQESETLWAYKKVQYLNNKKELEKAPCLESETIIEALFGDNTDVSPSFTSIGLPYCGYYALRDSWNITSRYLWFIASRRGTGHACENINSVDLIAFGRHLLIEAGGGSYGIKGFIPEDQQPVIEQIDDYRYKSFGHNTVIVDGNSQRRLIYGENADVSPYANTIGTRWLSSDRFDYCEGNYDDGYGNEKDVHVKATHIRKVIFVKEVGIYIITDIMIADAPHQYTQLWGFPPERFPSNVTNQENWESTGFATNEIHADAGVNMIWTSQKEKPNVFLYHFTDKDLKYDQYYGQLSPAYGWMAPTMKGRRIPKPDVHTSWNGDAGTSSLVTVIVPTLNENSLVKSKTCLSRDGISGFRIEFEDDSVTTYLTASETDQLSIDRISAVSKQLLVVIGINGKVTGIALDCESMFVDGCKVEIPYANFEFEIIAGQMEVKSKIIIPTGFDWKEHTEGAKPVYSE